MRAHSARMTLFRIETACDAERRSFILFIIPPRWWSIICWAQQRLRSCVCLYIVFSCDNCTKAHALLRATLSVIQARNNFIKYVGATESEIKAAVIYFINAHLFALLLIAVQRLRAQFEFFGVQNAQAWNRQKRSKTRFIYKKKTCMRVKNYSCPTK